MWSDEKKAATLSSSASDSGFGPPSHLALNTSARVKNEVTISTSPLVAESQTALESECFSASMLMRPRKVQASQYTRLMSAPVVQLIQIISGLHPARKARIGDVRKSYLMGWK